MNLTEVLTVFERELTRVSPIAAERLGPGLPAEETARVLRELDLEPPDDLLEWFAWHNGSAMPNEQFWSSVPIGPALWVASLTHLTPRYTAWVQFIAENLPSELGHEWGWFPIVGDASGGYVVVDCTQANREGPTQCALRTPEGRRTVTLPFVDCIRYWTDAILSGRWVCEEASKNYPDWIVYPERGPSLPRDVERSGLII